MPPDPALDRLKVEQDKAFAGKQAAWQAQDSAWKLREQAKAALDAAYRAKQTAYEIMNAAWQYYQSVRTANGPRIDSLNAQQETAYQRMKQAFENASSAYERKDGSAKSYANDGHNFKAESQRCVAQRRALVDEIRQARAQHQATKPAFEQAKSNFTHTKQAYDNAKANHQVASNEFKSAKAEFEKAKVAFEKRLETLREEAKRRKAAKRDIALSAGVPSQYLDDVYVSTKEDGTVNIYFGGTGSPDGEGHGHYVMDRNGKVTYKREPFDPHGVHNFTEYDEYEFQKTVDGTSTRTGKPQTNVYFGNKGKNQPHGHIAYDDEGNVVASRDVDGSQIPPESGI